MSHETARARFETFAAMGDGELPPGPIDALQVRLHRWQIAKFGLQPMERMVLGVVEEMGELAEAIRDDDHAETCDAVGDICIYMAQLLTLNRMAIGTVFDRVHAQYLGSDVQPGLMIAAGELTHVTLKRLQGIRGMGNDNRWRHGLFKAACNVVVAADYETDAVCALFTETAEHVMARSGDMLPRVTS